MWRQEYALTRATHTHERWFLDLCVRARAPACACVFLLSHEPITGRTEKQQVNCSQLQMPNACAEILWVATATAGIHMRARTHTHTQIQKSVFVCVSLVCMCIPAVAWANHWLHRKVASNLKSVANAKCSRRLAAATAGIHVCACTHTWTLVSGSVISLESTYAWYECIFISSHRVSMQIEDQPAEKTIPCRSHAPRRMKNSTYFISNRSLNTLSALTNSLR